MPRYEYIAGTLTGFAGGLMVSTLTWLGSGSGTQAPARSPFTVVDKYGACDVVRYESKDSGYVFFLDCQKDK
jgi:hypothetical protein